MATAYIETTIPSLYTGRPTQRPVEAARQNVTRIWWDNHRHEFELFCSQTVLDECSEGDAEMAGMRVDLLAGIPLLDLTNDVVSIAQMLLAKQIIPMKAAEAAKLRIESFDSCATTRGSRTTHVELYIRSNGS